ncbi:MFS transporter [Pseudonocardiaceae bacterium YIM PH 21723]|nr:MFS transporter [Pseudonocardiaceae bacterium YIM PH 21723]
MVKVRDTETRAPGREAVLAAAIGNGLEWFDWNVYAIFAVYFAPGFFPRGDPTVALLSTLAIFAVGFFFRPLGGLLLAAYADRHGRRNALTLATLIMAAGSLLIAVTPGYSSIGLAAPLLLLLARCAQGLSTGGEFSAAATYIAEIAPAGRRGLYGSVFYISVTVSTLFATLVAAVLTSVFGRDGVADWAWRLPFAFGALLGLYALYLRRRLPETEPFTRSEPVARPTVELLRRHPAQVARMVGFTLGGTIAFYTFGVYLPTYAQKAAHIPAVPALWAAVAAQLVFLLVLPLVGSLSDRIGRRPLLLGTAGGTALLAVPAFGLLNGSAWSLFLVMTAMLIVFAGYGAVSPSAKAEMFPTEVRAAGLGLPYALTVAIFGGTAPLVVESLAARGLASWFPWYIAVLCVISFGTVWSMRETSGDVF